MSKNTSTSENRHKREQAQATITGEHRREQAQAQAITGAGTSEY